MQDQQLQSMERASFANNEEGSRLAQLLIAMCATFADPVILLKGDRHVCNEISYVWGKQESLAVLSQHPDWVTHSLSVSLSLHAVSTADRLVSAKLKEDRG